MAKPGSSQSVDVASNSGPDLCWPHEAPAVPCMADSLAAGTGAGCGVREGLPGHRVDQLSHRDIGWRHPQCVVGPAVHPGVMFPGGGEPGTAGRISIRDRNANRGQRSRFRAGWWSHRASHHGREDGLGQLAVWDRDRLPRISDRPGTRLNGKDPRREKDVPGVAADRQNSRMWRAGDCITRRADGQRLALVVVGSAPPFSFLLRAGREKCFIHWKCRSSRRIIQGSLGNSPRSIDRKEGCDVPQR
jgi:hypothetical protein